MSLKAKLLLDSSDYNNKMDQAKAKANSAGKEIKEKLQQGGRGFEAINKFGGKFGGVLKNLTEGIAGLMSPIGIVMAGIAALGSLAVKVWDKMTLSAEQYSKKLLIEAQRSKKAYEDAMANISGDEQYFNRLQEIADAEHVSNEMKLQAIRIIDILTKKYGDLGISINMATGEIEGLTSAQQQFLKEAQKIAVSKLRTAMKDQENKTRDTVKTAMGGKSPSSGYTPYDFGGESHGTTMATYWNHIALANGKKGLEDKKNSFLSNDDEKKIASLILQSRQSIAKTQEELKKNPSSLDAEGLRFRLEQLKNEEAHYVNMLKLTQKLKVARAMIRNSKTAEDIDNWRKVEAEIQKAIDLQKQYYMQTKANAKTQQAFAQKGRKQSDSNNSKKTLALLNKQQILKKEADTIFRRRNEQGAKDAYEILTPQQKIEANRDQIDGYDVMLDMIEKQRSSLRDQLKDIERLQNISAKKIKNKTATPKEQSQFIELGRKEAEIRAKIAEIGKGQQQLLTAKYNAQKRIYELQQQQRRYYQSQKTSLDQQIQFSKLKLQGKNQQVERQKIINDLKAKGLKIDKAQIDEIMKKKKQLGALSLALGMKDQGNNLVTQAMKQAGLTRQANRLEAQKNAEKTKGAKLTQAEIDKVNLLADMQTKLSDFKYNFSLDTEIKTNEMTARGGFAKGAVVPEKNDVNAQIRDASRQQTRLLQDIRTILQNGGII